MKKLNKIFAAFVATTMILSGCGANNANGQSFTATAHGYEDSEFEVTTTFEDGKIVKVDASKNEETEGIGKDAVAALSEKIVETQSVDLDAVTGATSSSEGLLEAVKETITMAGLSVDDYMGNATVTAGEDETIDTEV